MSENTKLFYVIISLAIIILFYDLIIKNNIIILIQDSKTLYYLKINHLIKEYFII